MSFAENLKQLRKENHLSQEKLAEILDVSRQAVSKRNKDFHNAIVNETQHIL